MTYPCGHPRTVENTYAHTEAGKVRQRCRQCMLDYAETIRKARGMKPRPRKLIVGRSVKEKPCALAEIWK